MSNITNNEGPKNAYEAKLERKRERLEAMANQAEERSVRLIEAARELGQHLPFGQPILVDHHSANRVRRVVSTLERLDRKSIAEDKKALHYREMAAAVGTGGVSSEDPEAEAKLAVRLQELERKQVVMKAINKAVRKHPSDEARRNALTGVLSSEEIEEGLAPDILGRVEFPAYALTNNSANIRRIKARLEELRELAGVKTQVMISVEGPAHNYVVSREDHVVYFKFHSKPNKEVRALMKRNGFLWTPSLGVWSRKLSMNALEASRYVSVKLAAMGDDVDLGEEFE